METINKEIKCFLTTEVYNKIKYYIDGVNAEISGVGKSSIVDGDIHITDVVIFKQKCSSAHTDIDDLDQAKWMQEVVDRGESLKDWNVWWHSHNNFGVFWSGTDTNTIESHANNGGFLVSLVSNKKREFKVRVDIFPKDVSPFNQKYSILLKDDIPVEVLMSEQEESEFIRLSTLLEEPRKAMQDDIDACRKELEDKIKVIRDNYNEAYGEIDKQLSLLEKSGIIEDNVLKEKIDNEIKEKVSIPIFNKPLYGNYGYRYGNKTLFDDEDDDLNAYYKSIGKKKVEESPSDIGQKNLEEKIDEVKDSVVYDLTSDLDYYNPKYRGELDDEYNDMYYEKDDEDDYAGEDFDKVNNAIAKERQQTTIVHGFAE